MTGPFPFNSSFERRPRVAQVLHRLDYAGAEVLAAGLARRLHRRFEFLFCCLDGVGSLGRELAAEGFAVVELGRRPGVDLGVVRRLRRVLRERRVDLVHAHQYTPFFYAAAARGLGLGGGAKMAAGTDGARGASACRSARPTILFTEHGRHYPDHRRLKRVLANRVLLRGRDRVSAVGEFVKRALVTNEGLPAERIEVIHNGIDPDAFFGGVNRFARRAAARRALGIAPEAPVVLQVARFHPVKDHATSLRAFALMSRQHPDAVLVLAGDGEGRGEMEQLAGELGIAPQVRFLGVRTDVADLMHAADLFVLSSLSEGISVTLLEAMAARLPICATDVGGNGEVVGHEETGLLSPRRDAAALADNLQRMLASSSMRFTFAAAGHARLLQQFNQDRMHERYAAVYEQMAGVGTAKVRDALPELPARLAG